MKPLSAIAVLLFVSFSVCAQAATSCDDLKAEIAKKVEANGVKSYTLDIVDKDKDVAPESKVVGTCEGGTKKIVYTRTSTPPPPPAPEAQKP
ncbi:MAG: DUF1161 domain-containing protein [Candidatus Sulfotelmatobacter sp.]|jgi:hypothetical protein